MFNTFKRNSPPVATYIVTPATGVPATPAVAPETAEILELLREIQQRLVRVETRQVVSLRSMGFDSNGRRPSEV